MNRLHDVVDAVVIGTGAGGAPLTARLAAAGLSVVALEAGHSFNPQDHVADEVAADIYWMEERLSGGADPTAFGSNNSGMGVGGSTLHWGAFCPRPDARDLQLKSLTGQGADWPIPHAELIAYVEEVEAFTGVSGPADYPWDASRRYAYPTVPRNACLDSVFSKLQREPRVVGVVDAGQRLVGYITAENLTELVMIQSSRSARAEQAPVPAPAGVRG